jgi:3-methylcrotonyl-CoA carboxylase alpha subunit
MEMNTRLQVEHPVTEAVTGIDLVEWQLRVAAGEPLPLGQADIRLTGHAFEARLYAEDVPAGFLPATGRIEHISVPDLARVDSGVRPGDTISPWYDPMIAKIIVHGPTRDIALGLLDRALSGSEVTGTVTNLAFLHALVRNPDLAAGDVDTGLIARNFERLVAVPAPGRKVLALAAVAAAGLVDGGGPFSGFSLWAPLARTVSFGDASAVVEVLGKGHVRVETSAGTAVCTLRDGRWWIDGQPLAERAVVHARAVSIFGDAMHDFARHDPLAHDAVETEGGLMTHAPMPGLVRDLFVMPGDSVERGDKIAVLEAMKMEHTLLAGSGGRVAEVMVAVGAQVEAGAALVRLETTA